MKQYRIGIIGSENSHARAFAKVFAETPDFQDMKVTAVYGNEGREKSEKVCEFFPEARIVDEPADMLGIVDAVMIISRDGKFHYPYAKLFLGLGIPMFIDKPFTVDPDEARALVALAKEKSVPLCGGSSLKCCPDILRMGKIRRELGEKLQTGFASAPLDPESPYSGFFFYASHLAEMCLEVFGWEPEMVTATNKSGKVTAIVHYPDFDAICAYTPECGRYFVQLTGDKNILEATEVDMSQAYRLETEKFVGMLRSGEMPYSYTQLMEPVFVMNAIKEAYETGKTVRIKR